MKKYLVSNGLITLVIDDKVVKIQKSHTHYKELVKLLKADKYDDAVDIVKTLGHGIPKAVQEIADMLEMPSLTNVFTRAYMDAVSAPDDPFNKRQALELFFENVLRNPLKVVSVSAFAKFLTAAKMPITDRGTFLAYRGCTPDYKDGWTKTYDNRPGAVVRMLRKDCNDNQSKECSTGFHICNHSYLSNGYLVNNSARFGNAGAQHLVVEVRPQDVIAVPNDAGMSKMRVASFRSFMRLDEFKKQLAITPIGVDDVLTTLPFFRMSHHLKTFQTSAGVANPIEDSNFINTDEWLAYDGD